jgi:ribose transport system substrate-binding protein
MKKRALFLFGLIVTLALATYAPLVQAGPLPTGPQPAPTPTEVPANPTLDQDPGNPNQAVYWVKYNFETGAYETDTAATGDPKTDWKPTYRKAAEGTTICFTPESEEFPFDTQGVNPSMDKYAKEAGVKLLVLNNAYPSTTQPLANADACVTQGANLVVSFNVMAELSPAIMKKYDAAKIPVIAVDVTHPGSVFWGADNCLSGRMAGQFAVKWARDHNWPEDQIIIFTGMDPGVGGAPACRNTAFVEEIRAQMPKIPDANVFEVDMRTAELGVMPGALAATTDWLTAHPDAKYIVATTINDDRGVGIANAMAQAGRGDPTVDGIVIGKNADESGLAAIRRGGTPFVGSVAFFPDRYGEFLIPLALDILEGKPVPSIVRVPHQVITAENIDKWYPVKK